MPYSKKQKLQHQPCGQSKLTSFFPTTTKTPLASGNDNGLLIAKAPSASGDENVPLVPKALSTLNRSRCNDTALGLDSDAASPRVDSRRNPNGSLWRARELEMNNLLSGHRFTANTDGTMDMVSHDLVEDTPQKIVDRRTLLEKDVLAPKRAPHPAGPAKAISSSQPEKTLDENLSPLDQCRARLVVYIRLVQFPQWQYNWSPEVFAMLADLTEEEVVDMVVAGYHERLPEMMYGKGWNEAAASMFSGVREYFRQNGNYLHFLKTLSTVVSAELYRFYRFYGGMSTCETGFQGRFWYQHGNEDYRRRNPSYHYKVMDTPGGRRGGVVAVYPDGPYQRPLSNLNEGFLIAGLRLWPSVKFFNFLITSGFTMPALYDELDTAFIGLNMNAGLDWHCGPGNLNADTLFDDKEKNLVTKGVPVGIRSDHPSGNHVHFSLFRQPAHVASP